MSCAALLAAYGFALAGLDRHRVYEIPRWRIEQASRTERAVARGCAAAHGIKWKIVP